VIHGVYYNGLVVCAENISGTSMFVYFTDKTNK